METGKVTGNEVCVPGGNHSPGSQAVSRGHWASVLMQDSISRPRRLHWGVKKVGNDLSSTQSIMMSLGRRGRTPGEQIQTAPKEWYKNHMGGDYRRQELYAPKWDKGVKEPAQGDDHRVGKANEKFRPGGMRSEEDEVWRNGPWKSLGTTLSMQGLAR